MKAFRNALKYLFPVIIGIMVLGLMLSRVISPGDTEGPADQISAYQASDYVGERAEVCGEVASADHVTGIGGAPTFINLERAHPDQIFTIVIWEDYRRNWSTPPEELYANRNICVTGTVELHEGVPQIEARQPDRIDLIR